MPKPAAWQFIGRQRFADFRFAEPIDQKTPVHDVLVFFHV